MEGLFYKSPFGILCLTANEGRLTSCRWTDDSGPTTPSSRILAESYRWLDCYFSRKPLPPLPLLDHGNASPFTIQVREALMAVPPGSTLSYSAIAEKIGRPKACRAVGSACARNPFHILIPCHRILPSDGSVGNYAGGPQIKSLLLEFERRENFFSK